MSSPLLARSGLSLDRLASLIAIADAGGLSAAAGGDAVRQSQLSRQLKELEEFFGTTLIDRRRGAFRVTRAGQRLVTAARTSLSALDDVRRQCAGEPQEFRLAAGESLLAWLVIPRLAAVRNELPDVTFTLENLQTPNIVARVREGRSDFGIVRRDAVTGAFESAPLGTVRYALFAPAKLLPGRTRTSTRDLLAKLPLVVLEGGGRVNDWLTTMARDAGIDLRISLRCSSHLQAAEAVKRLGLAAILPAAAARSFAATAVKQVAFTELARLERPLALIWSRRESRVRSALTRIGRVLAKRLCVSRLVVDIP